MYYYPGQKFVTAEILTRNTDHVISCDTDFDWYIDATQTGDARILQVALMLN